MAQVKKESIRSSIIKCAAACFEFKGYNQTTMSDIANSAGVSSANIYVYFNSKIEIAFAVYKEWIIYQLRRTERKILSHNSTDARLSCLLSRIWKDIPRSRNGFARGLIQAVASTKVSDGYSPRILEIMESRIQRMLTCCYIDSTPDERFIISTSKIIIMAFDGFVIYGHLYDDDSSVDGAVQVMTGILSSASRLDDPARSIQQTQDAARRTLLG